MKNILTLFIGAVMLQSCIIIRTDRDGVYRNYDNSEKVQDFAGKPMESRDFEVKKFSEIKANSAMKVYIKKAPQQKVVVSSNAINYIVVSSEKISPFLMLSNASFITGKPTGMYAKTYQPIRTQPVNQDCVK